jgi:hypothetical protein
MHSQRKSGTIKSMRAIFACKQFLRGCVAHLWPLALLCIVVSILLVSQNKFGTIHTSPLAQTVFDIASGRHNSEWRDVIDVVLNIIAWLLILLLTLRILTGLLASNRRLFKRLMRWLKTRQGLHVTEVGSAYRLSAMGRIYRVQKLNDPIQNVLSYAAQTPQGSLRVTFQDKLTREGWRIKLGQATRATVQVPVDLPTVHILSKATSAGQSSIIERLRNPSQYVQLEGDFSDVFSVYVARGYEVYALDILNPAVMQKLKQSARTVDIELSGREITITQPSYAITPPELQHFEATVETCLSILRPHIAKQAELAQSKKQLQHQYQYRYFDPHIRPLRLYCDALLKILVIFFAIVAALILVSEVLPIFPDRTRTIGGFTLTYINPWKDTLEALSYLVIALAAVTFAASEAEILIRRIIASAKRRRARVVAN